MKGIEEKREETEQKCTKSELVPWVHVLTLWEYKAWHGNEWHGEGKKKNEKNQC
ncbi:hypothetical protein Scep_010187 [Stephania cephalantha]|uniref:Uncharacterized protein n=1 Tax=Stephania cephalantha TaxID=152367 RepID=A0AAP0JUZ6_9MAGN